MRCVSNLVWPKMHGSMTSLPTTAVAADSPEQVILLADHAATSPPARRAPFRSSPARPVSWPSTPPSKPPAPARRARDSPVVAEEVKAVSAEIGRLASDMETELRSALDELRAWAVAWRWMCAAIAWSISASMRWRPSTAISMSAPATCAGGPPTPPWSPPPIRRRSMWPRRSGGWRHSLGLYRLSRPVDLHAGWAVVAHGRADRYPGVRGMNVAHEGWFQQPWPRAPATNMRCRCHALRGAEECARRHLCRRRARGRADPWRTHRRAGHPFRLGTPGPRRHRRRAPVAG